MRRRIARARRSGDAGLSAEQRTELLAGIVVGRPFADDAARAAAWEAHRDALIAFHTSDPAAWAAGNRRGVLSPAPAGPGNRPAAWWGYEAPEPRRVVAVLEPDDATRSAHGVLARAREVLETEAAYLARLDLLTPAERQALEINR